MTTTYHIRDYSPTDFALGAPRARRGMEAGGPGRMTNPRDIRMTDIDWRTLLHDMGRSVRPLWRLSQHDPNRTPEDYGNGAWSALRLGEVADKGVRDILRHQDVGPKALDALHEIINMAIAGTLPLKGAPAPDSLWPADREENGRFSGDDYHEGIEEGWKAGAAQERRIWRMAVEQCFDRAAVRDVENYAQALRAIRRAGRETTND